MDSHCPSPAAFRSARLRMWVRAGTGFTLIEISVVLIVLAVLASTIGAASLGLIETRRREANKLNMQKAEVALANFVTSTKRLPCPADGALSSADVLFGKEQRAASGTCDVMMRGVLPWVTLGITAEDATDGWGSLFTYRVPVDLTRDNAMSMADCDPAGTGGTLALTGGALGCNTACTSLTFPGSCTSPMNFLTGKGFQIRNASGTILADPAASPPSGAAYALISAGPTYGPAYNSSGALVATSSTLGTEEARNQNNQATQAYYVDSDYNATETTAHFDDIVLRPTIQTVLSRANLGPRTH